MIEVPEVITFRGPGDCVLMVTAAEFSRRIGDDRPDLTVATVLQFSVSTGAIRRQRDGSYEFVIPAAKQ